MNANEIGTGTKGKSGTFGVAVTCARGEILLRTKDVRSQKGLILTAMKLAEDGPYTVEALTEALAIELGKDTVTLP